MLASVQGQTETIRISVKRPSELTASERGVWATLRASNPKLYSPYFHIGYTDMVATLRDDIQVIIVYDAGQPIAFLPFQGKEFARPVGAPMTDYQGFIKSPGTHIDASAILKSAGIGAYHFDSFIDDVDNIAFQSGNFGAAIDISIGGEAWRKAQDASYGRYHKNYLRKVKRSENERGPITFDMMSQDPEMFDLMVKWKREQFAQTGKYDVLSAGWTLDLLKNLWLCGPKANLRCDLHVVKINGQPAAIDLGLSDGKTYHSWMVTHDPEMKRYSAGIQMLEARVTFGQELGYDTIDLGIGIEGYKRYYANFDVPVGAGFIAASGPLAVLSKIYGVAESLTEKAPLGPISQVPGKLRRRYIQIAACDPTAKGRAVAMLQAFKGVGK